MHAILHPYPAYRDSGVEWLGKVPEHWEVVRAKGLFRKMERPIRTEAEVVTCFRDGTVTLRSNRRLSGFTESLKYYGYQGVRRGDLVIHEMDAFAGACGVADSDGKCTPVYSVCEPNSAGNANPRYYAGCIREMARSGWVLALSKGIRERSTDFRFSAFAAQPVPLPPLSEQTAITHYLDHAVARIRRYIGAKEKLLALLEEQKRAVVHEAVTGRIDVRTGKPYPAYRDSGLDWLGKVPEHWEVRRMKYLLRETDARSDSGTERLLRVSQYTGVTENTGSADGSMKTRASTLIGYKIVERDELAVNIMLAWNGSLGVAAQRGIVSPAYCVYQFRDRMQPWYYHHLLRSTTYKSHIKTVSTGVVESRLRLYTDNLYRLVGLVPPLTEQNAIARYLDAATAAIDRAIKLTRRQIALAEEYLTRLISDVVTGKLDVRAATGQFPIADPATDGSRGAGIQTRSVSRTARSGIAATEARP